MAALFDWGLEGGDESLGSRLLAALDQLAPPGTTREPVTPTEPSDGSPETHRTPTPGDLT
jgi:hypothetical protein